MKLPDAKINISTGARTFLLLSISLAYHMFNSGFELGVHGELYYFHKIAVWSMVTGALLALLVLPKQETGIQYWQLIILLIPTLWIAAISYFGTQNSHEIIKPLLFLLMLISQLFCLPYALYIVLNIVNPDVLTLKGSKPKIAALALSVFFLGTGYLTGKFNYQFMSCKDFEIAGDMAPDNCLVVKTE